jgi:putative membrane protein
MSRDRGETAQAAARRAGHATSERVTEANAPRRSIRAHDRLPLALLGIAALICLVTVWSPPAGRVSWLLEVGPGLLGIAVMLGLHRRFPFSHWVQVCVFLHLLILIYGGYYTYALTPLGNWAAETLHLARNHYDRVGHLALGVFPAFTIREVLLRCTPLRRGGWLYFLILCVVLAIAAFWELLEWWVTLIVAGDVGQAFLGSQGDIWDAQWDMLLALVGAAAVLPIFARSHDRSMARIPGA